MHFVSSALDMPIFMATRSLHRPECRDTVRKYIGKQQNVYTNKCSSQGKPCELREQKEPKPETYNHKKFKHILGFDEHREWCQSNTRTSLPCRNVAEKNISPLGPTSYRVPIEIMADRKGEGGAHWARLHKTKKKHTKKSRKTQETKSAEISSTTQRLEGSCHKYKGVFASNPRERRPTSRLMVSDQQICYRDPDEPGPASYNIDVHTIAKNVSPPVKVDPPNPHSFLKNSTVPEKPLSIHRKNTSFEPAVARYETRYRIFGTCRPRAVYVPGIQLRIEREKRMKFRRRPFMKIDPKKFYDPEWRHVYGHGFRRLFRKPSRGAIPDTKIARFKRSIGNIQMYPDAAYMAIINFPERKLLSLRMDPPPRKPFQIRYNHVVKRSLPKLVKNEKKIAFMSGQERFKDSYRPLPLTQTQLMDIINSLPEERRLHDYPVMRCSVGDVRSRLHDVPSRMLPPYLPNLRKPRFKFLPLPKPKVLVTAEDIQIPKIDGKYDCEKFFGKKIKPEDYFSENVDQIQARAKEVKRRREEAAARKTEREKALEARERRRKISIKVPEDAPAGPVRKQRFSRRGKSEFSI